MFVIIGRVFRESLVCVLGIGLFIVFQWCVIFKPYIQQLGIFINHSLNYMLIYLHNYYIDYIRKCMQLASSKMPLISSFISILLFMLYLFTTKKIYPLMMTEFYVEMSGKTKILWICYFLFFNLTLCPAKFYLYIFTSEFNILNTYIIIDTLGNWKF